MLLIIETHAASDLDFQRWVCRNTHLIRVYSTVQRKTCQTSRLGSHRPRHSHGLGSVLQHHLHQTRLAATWTLDLRAGLWCAHPLDRRCAVCYVDDTLLLPRTLRVGLDQNGRLKGQIASWEPNKWNGMNEIPHPPSLIFFFLCPSSIPFHFGYPRKSDSYYCLSFSSFDCNMCYYLWLYMNIITLPLNLCLNCDWCVGVGCYCEIT